MIASYAPSLKPAAPARSLPATLAEMREAAARYFSGAMPAALVNLNTAIGPVHVLPNGTIRVGHILR